MRLNVLIFLAAFVCFTSCKKSSENLVVYQNSLASPDSKWATGVLQDGNVEFNNGSLQISVLKVGDYVADFVPNLLINYPYSIKVDALIQLSDSTKIGYGGIVYNWTDSSNYSVFICDTYGQFELWSKTAGAFTNPVPWTSTGALRIGVGKTNTIELVQNLNSTEIIINGTVINTFPSFLSANSYAGLLAQPAYSAQNFTSIAVSFNNILIKKLQ